jgi:K+-sensing histidine kinase KdpD
VEKDVSIGLFCHNDLTAQIHVPLLTQALVNLLDNAINFSAAGSTVQVVAEESADGVSLCVFPVMPAKAGIPNHRKRMDSGSSPE